MTTANGCTASVSLGKLLVGGVAGLGLAATCYGYWRHPLWQPDLWPDKTLPRLGFAAAAYAVVCSLVWCVPALRRRQRMAFAILTALAILGGAGAGGLLAPLIVLGGALALGSLVLRPSAHLTGSNCWAYALVSTVVGLCLLSLVIWGLSHYPINVPLLHAGLLTALMLAARKQMAAFLSPLASWFADERQEQGPLAGYLLGCVAVGFMLVHVNVAMWPEMTFDAITYHLRIINQVEWHKEFNFDITSHVLNLVPYLADQLFLAAYLLGGEGAAKMLNAMFLLMSLGTIWGLVRTTCSASCASLAVALFASTPLCICTSLGLFSENAMTLTALALWVGLVYLPESDDPRWDLGMAALMAFPILLKPYGLLFSLAAALIWIALLWKRRQPRLVLRALWVGALAVLLASPPYLYAWKVTGNPVFPFKNSVFRSPYYPPVDFADMRWTGHLSWPILYRMTFNTPAYSEVFPGAIGLAYLVLVPCALLAWLAVRNRVTRFGPLLAAAFAGGLLLMIQYARYLVPALAFAAVLGVIAIDKAVEPLGRLRRLGHLLLLLLCVANLFLLPTGHWGLRGPDLATPFSAKSRDAFLRSHAAGRLVTQCINTVDGDTARVAFLGSPWLAGLRGSAFFNESKQSAFYEAMSRVDSERGLCELIGKWQLTHFVWEGDIQHRHAPLLAHALGKLAAWRHDIQGVTVVRIDPTSVQRQLATCEQLKNIDLVCPLQFPWMVDRVDMSPPGTQGVLLRPGGTLVQRVQGNLEGQHLLQVEATGTEDKTDVARLQIRWFLADNSQIPVWSEAKPVRGSEPQTLRAVAVGPKKAVAAEVYVVHQSGDRPITIRRVSLCK